MSSEKSITPTPSQQAAIDARGQNILVNAGAGAGKTSTLTQRVIGRLLEPGSEASLEKLVIVTFTRAAAAEMRERIGKELRKQQEIALKEKNDDLARRLESEIQSLPRAQISTLHSYCSTLLREFGDRVGVPPDFELIDEDEAMLLHHERVREEIEAIAGDPDDGPIMREMLRQLSPSRGSADVEKVAVRLQHFLGSLDDPEDFVRMTMKDYELIESGGDFKDTRWYRLWSSPLKEAALQIRSELERFLQDAQGLVLSAKVPLAMQEAVEARSKVLNRMDIERDVDELAEFLAEKPFLPPRNNPGNQPDNRTHHELSGPMKEAVTEALNESKHVAALGSTTSIAENIARSVPFVRLFLYRLGLEMNEKLIAAHIAMRRLRFSDLERLALRILESPDGSPTDAAHAVRSRTAEILVDEYQDVNGLQSRLLEAIARPSGHEDGGNLFVVGDLKQSIYGFRLADPRKFKAMYRAYAPYDPREKAIPGAHIDLVENYRSHPALLHLFNQFFGNLFTQRIGQLDFDSAHRFVAGERDWRDRHRPPFVDILLLDSGVSSTDDDEPSADQDEGIDASDDSEDAFSLKQYEEEACAVAEEILQLQEEGFALSDIAVLSRTGRAAATKLSEVFQRLGIPYHTEAATGFLQQQEILDFKALLRALDNPYEDVALVSVLRGPVAGWSEDDLVRLRLLNRHGALIENLRAVADDGEGPLFAKARTVVECLDRWRLVARRRPMGELFALILEETDWCASVLALPNGEMRESNLLYLVERAVQFDGFQRKGLAQFLRFLEELEDNDRDLGSPPSVPPSGDVVRIMTIHKSKGLEFPVVILPFLGTKFNQADLSSTLIWDQDLGVAARFLNGAIWGGETKSAARELIAPSICERLLSEELRLLYVAMTRAEKRLIMMGTKKAPKNSTIREYLTKQAERLAKGGDAWRFGAVGRAKNLLDWVILGFLDSPRMQDPVDHRVDTEEHLRVRLIPESAAGSGIELTHETAEEKRRRVQADLSANDAAIRTIMTRINAISDQPVVPAIKVKLTATEAKRAWQESQEQEGEDEQPVRWLGGATMPESAMPDWWPTSLKGDSRVGGKQRGNINHKFMEKLDLEAFANGVTLEEEAERMVREGILDPDDTNQLLLHRLREVLELEPLGPTLIARRHTVRREVPFRIGLNVQDLSPDFPAGNEIVMLQGVIDLLYEEENGHLVVVDWKTDRWDGTQAGLDHLVDAYRAQVLLYAEGLRRATGREVDCVWLVFLQAGQPVRIEVDPEDDAWLNILRSSIAIKV